ncbi:MAG: hypothetical protein ACYDAG_18205 [Chloroflexota bacterium]
MAKRDIRDLGDTEITDPDLVRHINQLEDAADRDIEAMRLDAGINLRWGQKQVAVVKRAAALVGVPYQTYAKQVLFKQAVADLRDAKEALDPR